MENERILRAIETTRYKIVIVKKAGISRHDKF